MPCSPRNDEHEGYTATSETWEETLPHKIVIWRVHRCQCGARTQDVKAGERPL